MHIFFDLAPPRELRDTVAGATLLLVPLVPGRFFLRLRCDSDTVEAFLTERIVKIPDGRIKKLDLYRSYEAFCQDMERQSLTKQNFYRSMKTKGFGEIKTNGTECFRGIEYRGKLPESSPENSLNEWTEIPDGWNPFDQK